MRLEETTVEMIRRAVDVYLKVAWGDLAEQKRGPADFSAAANLDEALALFRDERPVGKLRKYALRLGNPRYAFMKLLFQELLVRDRFFFSVDTHDDLDMKDSYSDFELWLGVKRFNADLKVAIDRAWQAAGVPTFASVVAEMEREARASADHPDGAGRLVLIVDDDKDIAAGVETILSRQGYRTAKVHDVVAAREFLGRERPDLVLSDLEMPGETGLDLARWLRADPTKSDIAFILATAASIDSSHFRLIDGYLVKPFETGVLLKFVAGTIARKRPGRAADDAAAGPVP